jgi:hypothetical protein
MRARSTRHGNAVGAARTGERQRIRESMVNHDFEPGLGAKHMAGGGTFGRPLVSNSDMLFRLGYAICRLGGVRIDCTVEGERSRRH